MEVERERDAVRIIAIKVEVIRKARKDLLPSDFSDS